MHRFPLLALLPDVAYRNVNIVGEGTRMSGEVFSSASADDHAIKSHTKFTGEEVNRYFFAGAAAFGSRTGSRVPLVPQ